MVLGHSVPHEKWRNEIFSTCWTTSTSYLHVSLFIPVASIQSSFIYNRFGTMLMYDGSSFVRVSNYSDLRPSTRNRLFNDPMKLKM